MEIKHLRYQGERTSLLFSFIIVLFISLVILQINFWLLILIIVFQLVYIILSQKQLIGNSIFVNENQFSDIFQIAKDNAEELKIKMPKVFITQDPYLNAYTIGFKKPYSIILTSSLVDAFTRDELDFVIGHEMGHIKFGHSKYLSFISPIGRDIPFFSLLYAGWQRRTEYTSDRTGYSLIGKTKPAISALIKITVGNKLSNIVDIEEIIKQIKEGKKGVSTRAGEFLLTHPYVTNRIAEIVNFVNFSK